MIGVCKIDLLDLSSRTVYKFEDATSISELQLIKDDILLQNLVDVIYIDLDDLPNDIFQRYMKLKEFIYST